MNTDIGQMLVVFVLVVLPIWLIQVIIQKNQLTKKINHLKSVYDSALAGSNRMETFRAGREYYSLYKKQNRLTFDEEQAIVNDLKNAGKN